MGDSSTVEEDSFNDKVNDALLLVIDQELVQETESEAYLLELWESVGLRLDSDKDISLVRVDDWVAEAVAVTVSAAVSVAVILVVIS